MAFGCRGHEFSLKGLQGCGSTATAAVGSKLSINFVAFDKSVPSLATNAKRQIRIVSPCATGEVYCPALSERCGTSDCATRQALLAQDDSPAQEFFSLRFDDAIRGGAITTSADGPYLVTYTPCGQQPALPLSMCFGFASGCGVYFGDARPTSPGKFRLSSHLSLPMPAPSTPSDVCAVAFLERGECAHGDHLVVYQAFVGSRNASDVAHVLVRVGERLVAAQVRVTVLLEVAGHHADDTNAAVSAAFVGKNQLTNAALHLAGSRLAEILYECSRTPLVAFGKDGGNDIHISLTQLGTPVLTSTFNTSNNHTTVEV
jgi:hypothetical protein